MGADNEQRSPDEVRSFFSTWLAANNGGDWETVAEMMHPDIVLVDPMMPAPAYGRAAAVERARGQYEPFADGIVTMLGDPFVALEEPELAYRWRFDGTHTEAIDPPGFAATGERVSVEGTSVLRFDGDQVVSVHLYFDTTEVARQLLAAPPSGSVLERVVALGQRVRVKVRRRVRRT